jgi:cytochrome c-type biogenesis protein
MTDVSFPVAFGAGLLSFLSPCVLPLAPPYLCYIAGASMEALVERGEQEARRDVLVGSLYFVAGFATVFVALGATASELGSLVREWSHALSIVAGIGIIAMGAHFLGLLRFDLLNREARVEVARAPGPFSAYLMGLAFAFGWTPCIGPILTPILALASAEDTVGKGALLLGVYAAGLGLPFVAAAAAMGPFLRFAKVFKRHFGLVERGVGVALVLAGVAFLSGGLQTASGWLIDAFPALTRLG